MAGTLNKVTLIGNVGKDPEIRSTQDGKEIACFSIATSDVWRDKSSGEKRERTEWHKIVVFVPQLVTLVRNYIHKGSKIYIEGALQTRKWMDQSNIEKYTTEIVLQSYNSSLILLDSKGGEGTVNTEFGGGAISEHSADSDGGKKRKPALGTYEIEEIDDDIPF